MGGVDAHTDGGEKEQRSNGSRRFGDGDESRISVWGASVRKAVLFLLLVTVLVAAVFVQRHRIMVYALGVQDPPGLLDPVDEGAAVRWHDSYFTVQKLDERTFAIGEPRYWQQNFSYLIVGSERALLFDAGPGLRDIRPVAESLTERPITFVPSHFHYDHVGNGVTFERVAVVDLPYLRQRAPDGLLQLSFEEHLGAAERIGAPTLHVDEWLLPGSIVSLGDRSLRVLYTPGHTEDSISLLDISSGYVFSGDFIYPGPLVAFAPNSNMGDYLRAALAVIGAAPTTARVFGAHRSAPPGAPELGMSDVEDLRDALRAIRDGRMGGKGIYPAVYRINEEVELWAEPRWLQRWEAQEKSNAE